MSVICSTFDCPICGIAEKEIKFYGFGHCNHPICGTCAIKLRKFSKDIENDYDYSKCAICKQDNKKIIITSKIDLFENNNEASLLSDDKFGLIFESNLAKEFYNSIIQISCPECKTPQETMEKLIKHLEIHRKRYCELCVSFKKCLQYELDVLTDNEYHQHRNKKHPKCRFCEIRFYDDSHLIKHVKEQHFLCDICHRSRGFVSFSTQNELLKHYAKDHHVCEICRLNNNINVFESEYHLKTHKVASHSMSLVNEGLVSINYGDRDNLRYGARRRAREMNGDVFEESQQIEAPQLIPTMDCEHEFPRLGADSSPNIQQQLGTQSLTMDENDARTAFNDRSSHCSLPTTTVNTVSADPNSNSSKQSQSSQHKPEMTMSNNFAISLKRSVGNLNREDFPTLSSTVSTASSKDVERNEHSSKPARYTNPATSTLSDKQANISKNSSIKEDDFPSLPTTAKGARLLSTRGPSNQSWGPSMKPIGNASAYKKQVISASIQTAYTKNQVATEDINEHSSIEINDVIALNKPKVCLMSREEFEQSSAGNSNKSSSQLCRQVVPGEQDFPSLGLKSQPGASAITKVGAWGKFQVPSTNNSIDISQHVHKSKKAIIKPEEKFAIQSPMDFPELPFKELSVVDTLSTKKKNKPLINLKKKSVVTASITNSNGLSSTKHTPTVEKTKRTKSPSSTKQHASSRNNDYIPSVATPTRDPIMFVDSTRFSMIKSARDHEPPTSTEFSLDSKVDFPGTAVYIGNRFGVLGDSAETGNVGLVTTAIKTARQPNKASRSKADTLQAPTMSSESEFPSLGVHPVHDVENSKSNQAQKPVESRRRGGHQQDASKSPSVTATVTLPSPVVSLMDVAMSVTRTQYTPFSDADTRNETMFLRVSSSLAPELAGRFLQLANLYRTRQLSVRDYLANIDSEFADDMDSIATMLPEMCVLLPDIPLQRSLLADMPKHWIRDLRECSKCDQVLHKADITVHNQLAH